MKPDASSAALRAFAVLEAVVKANRPISMSGIVAELGLPKPTIFRILSTLEHAGLVLREPSGKDYTVGNRLACFGLDIMMNNSVRMMRHAILQKVAEEIGETCNLTMLDGSEVVYIDRVESSWPLKVDLKPGSLVPLHCSASGKLFLSQLPRPKRRKVLESLVLARQTERTITDIDLLEAELDRVEASQVAVDNEEYLAGLVCVAVPITLKDGQLCASLAVQAPVARLTVARALEHVPLLKRAAERMAATFEVAEISPAH